MDNYLNVGRGESHFSSESGRNQLISALHSQGFHQVFTPSLTTAPTYRLFEKMNFDTTPPTKRYWIVYKGC